MGKILRGYDRLALDTLRLFLSPLRYNIPKVVVYLEQIGDGAAIMKLHTFVGQNKKSLCSH